jgi:hypothetical protein
VRVVSGALVDREERDADDNDHDCQNRGEKLEQQHSAILATRRSLRRKPAE